MVPLPPKRFEPADDPRYDTIRPRYWFRDLEIRSQKIPLLREAYRRSVDDGIPQYKAAEGVGLDRRELYDYIFYRHGLLHLDGIKPSDFDGLVDKYRDSRFCHVLNEAAEQYQLNNGEHSITHYISAMARPFGLKARWIIYLWEVDPAFLPK